MLPIFFALLVVINEFADSSSLERITMSALMILVMSSLLQAIAIWQDARVVFLWIISKSISLCNGSPVKYEPNP
jgi:hypothetical protein